jgi:transcriptional regulator of acetoin/glycerol metabolism
VAWFLSQLQASSGKPSPEVSQEVMELLLGYSWPGNVRELKSVIEWAAVRCKGPIIQVKDLPPNLSGQAASMPPLGGLSQDEKQRILDALERAGGKRAAAARLLGWSRSTLYRRMRELGIETEGTTD